MYAMISSQGAMFWMTPCVAFSIVVGLGLDYGEGAALATHHLSLPALTLFSVFRADVFFMESAVEFYDEGASGKDAVLKALEQTGNIICVAGERPAIMLTHRLA